MFDLMPHRRRSVKELVRFRPVTPPPCRQAVYCLPAIRQDYRPHQGEAMNRMKKEHPYDLRADERVATMVEVICRPYTSTGNVRSAEGVMRNFSSQGSYIETDLNFKPGTILIVRMVGCLPTPSSAASVEKPRSICLCEIKWRHDLMDPGECRFGMGLRYLD